MSPTDTIYQGIPQGIQQMLDVSKSERNQEAEWLAEDIKMLATRNPKITTQLFKVAVHHSEAGDLSQVKPLQSLYRTLKQFVAELTNGKYPTLLSLHYNDGLADEGWEAPPHDMAEPTALDKMRADIHTMKQSPLITKDDIRALPVSTEDQYVYLKNLIGNRAVEVLSQADPIVDDTEPLMLEPKPVEKELTAGEAIIERRKMMVQSLLNPKSADPSLLAEAKALVSQGDVGLMMEMNRLTPDTVVINTVQSALSYTDSMETVQPDTVQPDTKPAKLTARLKADVKNVVNSITQDIPSITLERLLEHPRFVAAAHAERDTPYNLYERLMRVPHDIQFPKEAACLSVTTAETSPVSSSIPASNPTVSIAPQPEDSVSLHELPSTVESNRLDLLSPEKLPESMMTTPSSITAPLSAEAAVQAAILTTSIGSTTSSVNGTSTAGDTTSHTTPSNTSAPILSLSTLLQKRKELESELTLVKQQIAQHLAAEEAEEASLRARLKAIEEAKRALLDG
jgi:hypothetical protein